MGDMTKKQRERINEIDGVNALVYGVPASAMMVLIMMSVF